MTEKEKMLAGQLYDPSDSELEQLRLNAKSNIKSSKNYYRIREKFLYCRHLSILITVAIHILENIVGQILILLVWMSVLSTLEIM